jgi:type IV pilus assembly protein PilO
MDFWENLKERFFLLPRPQKIVLGILPAAIVVLLLVYWLIAPLWQERLLLQQDIARERLRLDQIKRARAQIEQFQKEMAEIDLRFRKALAMLPEAKEIPPLLKNVSELAHQQNLEFALFKPEKETSKEFVAEVPIAIQVKGSYHQLALFFDQVRRLPRIINARQLELGSFEEKTGQIAARCQLVTYRFLPIPQPPPREEKKKP